MVAEEADRRPRPAAEVDAGRRRTPPRAARSSWRSAATARSCAPPSWPAAGAPLLGINLGKVGFLAEAESDDLDSARRGVVAATTRWTSGSPSTCGPSSTARLDRRAWALNEVSVEKGQRAADARAAGRRGRPAAVPVRLRRCGVRHADRFDGVRVLGRRPGGVARGGGAAAGADQRARAVQPAAGDRADVRRSPSRSLDPYTAFAVLCCDGRRTLGPAARARGSRCGAATLPVRLVRLHAAAVHRPAGGEVRPAGGRLARLAGGAVGVCQASPIAARPVLEELRITGLGVIDDPTLALTPG